VHAVRALLIAAVAALALPSVASAFDYPVTTTGDHADKLCDAKDCSLRDAVIAAGPDDTIRLPAGNYKLSLGELDLSGDVINGAGARTTSIDGAGASRVLRVTGDGDPSRISGVTVTGGNGVGGGTTNQGGGIFVSVGSSLVMTDSMVSANTARTTGGGVVTYGTFTMVGGTISGNTVNQLRTAGTGGGVSVQSTGLAQLGNVTVSGNAATSTAGTGAGGGIYTLGRTNLINITVAGNTASAGAALWQAAPSAAGGPTVQTLMSNSILAATTGAACAGPGIPAPSAITSNHDVVTDGSCQLTGEGERQDANPQLGALANNGGPTNTQALAFNSAAINSGGATGCFATDQRGIARPQGGTCDSGAYEYRSPQLTVVTGVINDAGGTRSSADFTVHVRSGGQDVKGSPQPGSATGTPYPLDAGKTYVVAADPVTGYSRAVGGDCDPKGAITLQEGQNRTCTVTANDIDPRLTVVTTVVNDNGGTLAPAGVQAHVLLPSGGEALGSPQPGSAAGTSYTLDVGTHTVSAAVTGYRITYGGDCAGNGTVPLALADAKTCTITADDIAPTLRLITVVVNDDNGTAEPGDFDAHVRAGTRDVAGSPKPGDPNGTVYTLSAGTAYAVSAEGVPGYSATASGDCAANGAITLNVGEAKQCTVTVDDGASTLTVITQVINDNGGTRTPDSLSVHVQAGAADVTGSPQAGSATGTSYGVPADTYTVAAVAVPGYAISTSGDCDGSGTVVIGLAESRTCTVTANDVAPTLRVITTVVNDSGGTRAPSGFTVHVRTSGADVAGSPKPGSSSGTTYSLSAGTYAVGADTVAGYATSIGGACAAGGSVSLQPGDAKTCTVSANDNAVVRQQQLPPPQPGKNVNALPKTGTVKVKLPGSSGFVLLDEDEQIPLGTIVDVRRGRVTIVAAAGDGQTADFYGGIFKLGQTKGAKPITVVKLVEKLSCAKKKQQASAAKKKKRKRRLWGDGTGRFRTKGKHSAATVVGTKWLVEDRCTSTLTRVARGRVKVRDFVKKKTVFVKAGKKYVARARR
jgi:CSLREA domain-containing protein